MKFYELAKFGSFYRDWNNESLAKWERVRKRGMISFVMTFGVMKWGGFMLSVFTVKNFILGSLEILSIDYLVEIFLWFCGGFLFGYVVWRSTEICYYIESGEVD